MAQKGFLLVVVVLLAAAFFASYYNDVSGYATKTKIADYYSGQPVTTYEEGGGSAGPTNIRNCALSGSCEAFGYFCEIDEYCNQIGGTLLSPICGCIKKLGQWVDTNTYCGVAYSTFGSCYINQQCPSGQKCMVGEKPEKMGNYVRCNCFRFEEGYPVS